MMSHFLGYIGDLYANDLVFGHHIQGLVQCWVGTIGLVVGS
jgi:hypothetical protein